MSVLMFRPRAEIITDAITAATATTRCDHCWAQPGTACERGLRSVHAVRLGVAAQHNLISAATLEAALAGRSIQNYTLISVPEEMP